MKVVAEKMGFMMLLGIVVFTGFVGISLAKSQGKAHLQKMKEELAAGRLPGSPLIEALMILVAAAVLITPGFLTDFLGFLLLVPFIRKLLAPMIVKVFKPKSSPQSNFMFFENQQQGFSDNSTQDADFFDMSDDAQGSSGSDGQIEDKDLKTTEEKL
jgi:UPF0716 protein FxsA